MDGCFRVRPPRERKKQKIMIIKSTLKEEDACLHGVSYKNHLVTYAVWGDFRFRKKYPGIPRFTPNLKGKHIFLWDDYDPKTGESTIDEIKDYLYKECIKISSRRIFISVVTTIYNPEINIKYRPIQTWTTNEKKNQSEI